MAWMDVLVVREQRPGCAAPVHDTRHAWEKKGCRCPLAGERKRADGRRYYHSPAGQAKNRRHAAARSAAAAPRVAQRRADRRGRIEDAVMLVQQGERRPDVARRMGITPRSLERWLVEYRTW